MTRTTRVTQVLSLLLVTLTMGQLYAHVLEFGPKMHYPPELYLRLNTSLYAWYGPPLGAAINTGAVIATGALASDFIALRAQWEYGHALDFALYAVAFLLLVLTLVGLAAPCRASEPFARLPTRAV